jgi:hypothetical protein
MSRSEWSLTNPIEIIAKRNYDIPKAQLYKTVRLYFTNNNYM